MAVPKKKTSKSKRNKRRFSNRWVLVSENSVSCSNCGATRRQHRVCDDCGHYDGNQVFHPDTQAS